jgi:hypothetical protein
MIALPRWLNSPDVILCALNPANLKEERAYLIVAEVCFEKQGIASLFFLKSATTFSGRTLIT